MRYALVVPGHSRGGRITARCHSLLASAAALADRDRPEVVVLTGRTRFSGPSEAEQMLAAWPGRRDVELVAEPTALTTAQNAARSLRLLRERGIDEAIVVCAPAHAVRVSYLFGGVFGAHGVRCTVSRARCRTSAAAVLRELAAGLLMGPQRRAALAELADLRGG